MGSEYWQQAFRPLLPNVFQFDYNDDALIEAIDEQTACIIIEPIQSEMGVVVADDDWLLKIRNRCSEVGAMLILDEIQTAFGRTGSLFRFTETSIVPDILLLGKALGGGMPLGAFISSKENMDAFTNNPVLGHITTFGGHPVSCAAGLAALQFILEEDLIAEVESREMLFIENIQHPFIRKISSCGLLMALHFDSYKNNKKIIDLCIESGVFTDWFLFAPHALRIAPPLIISEEEIIEASQIIVEAVNSCFNI
jgi:acetylornithine/succinyldiaminopimelate/putrescine aminotransferase